MRTPNLLLLSVLLACYFKLNEGQGSYPPFTSVATYRPVMASSECGGGETVENFCEFTADATASLAPNCIEAVCNGTCPYGSASPAAIPLATLGTFGVGVTTVVGRPSTTTSALRFDNSSIAVPGSRVALVGDAGFSFSSWINQDPGNTGTLISKSNSDSSERNYAVSISETSITLDYLHASVPPTNAQRFSTVSIEGANVLFDPTHWHLVTVTVYDVDAVFYVNESVVGVRVLNGRIQDTVMRDVLLGQLSPDGGFFNGLMQDISYYTRALTAREVTELYTGTFPSIHLSSECHCPPSHPLVDAANEAICVQQPGNGLPSRGTAERLNPLAHPPSFANDFATSRGWISSPGQRDVNITFTLTNSLYELIFINIRYGSPRPRASVWETSRDGGMTFEPVQYYANDCMLYFGLPDDGPIVNADDVNCVTTTSLQTPTFNGDVRTHFLNQARTSNFDLNTSPELRQFILASHFRLRFIDFFESSTTVAHRYYNILEATVVARCACNGHSARCGSDINSVCDCVHNTQGLNCEQCLPFYNDKPWQYGTTDNAFPCKPCDCNSHSTSCHYDSTVDPFPDSYDLGGGGVCDDCQDNTAGSSCETCAVGYFAPSGTLPSDPTPCIACGCNNNGITDAIGDCAKGQGSGGEILGQCSCKPRVTGLKCDTCDVGFFNLTATDPDGCTPCGCNTDGTFEAVDTCNSTGHCPCKTNVIGAKCDQCRPGTTNLSPSNVGGCDACGCDSVGSANLNCDPVTGRCECKSGVGGVRCDACLPGFFGFSESGCERCECVPEGALNNVCNSVTGVCSCANNVIGDRCNACEDGFYNVTAGCVSCDCNTAGTENGASVCDKTTGFCPCKANVVGEKCDSCLPGFSNLIGSSPDGCSACDCFGPNTNSLGVVCNPVTLQCECDATATGLRCESCVNSFYQTDSGCVSCDCVSGGSQSDECETVTGQCVCGSVGVAGRRCDSCLPGFFQYPTCSSCGCDPAGSVEGTLCDPVTGVCSCKQYVTGTLCDSCVPGFQQLEASNPLGCSAQPDEQAPPTVMPASPTSVLVTWLEPEAPNGLIISYTVYRDGSPVATVTTLNYADINLIPNTRYLYSIEAVNSVGTTRSVEVEVQTLEGIPEGIDPPTLTVLSAYSVRVLWVEPATPNGMVVRYEAVIVRLESEQIIVEEISVFNTTGDVFTAVVSNLTPFTIYNFIIRACTSGGCGSSEPLAEVQTLQAPPTFQPAPNVTTISSQELLVNWVVPPIPNGIVSRYEVFLRDFPFSGVGESLTNTSELSFLTQGLRPFAAYEFSVASFTAGGGVLSAWVQGTTGEAAPEGVVPPTITPHSATSLQLSWSEPTSPNGIIRRYGIYQVTMGINQLVGDFTTDPETIILNNLSPFTEYSFLLEVCTAIGCTNSDVVTMATLEGDPIGQSHPTVVNVTSTSVSLSWAGPMQPNGIITRYSVSRRRSSATPLEQDVGVAFYGTGLASFAAGIANLGSFSNEIRLIFRTLVPQGVILYYINQAGSDLLAIELRGGVPYFIFDAGTGSADIAPVVQSGVTFSDGEWHSLIATQNGRTGSILVDGVYSGTGVSPGQDSVIASSQALHIGGTPSLAPLRTIEGGATLSRSRFAGCLFSVVLNGEEVDMTQSSLSEGVDIVNGCPVDVGSGWRLVGNGYVALEENSIRHSDFSLTFELHSLDSDALVLFAYSADLENALSVEIRNSSLYVVARGNETRELLIGRQHAPCVMNDLSIRLTVNGTTVLISTLGEDSYIVTNLWPVTILTSAVYFGGVPRGSPGYALAVQLGLNVATRLSGCVRSVELVSGGVSVGVTVGDSSQVRFDGCGPRGSGCVSPVEFNVGTEMSYTDTSLESFTDYLHRVSASNSVGTAVSGWVATTTLPGVPALVTVSLVASMTDSLSVTWTRPSVTRGLITSYDITALPTSTVGLPSPRGSVSVSSLVVSSPEMVLVATLDGLEPATTYEVTVTALTSGGASTGPPTKLSTGEAVPVGVQAPMVTLVESRRLGITWQQPIIPNGIIVRFDLFVDGAIRFSGPNNSTIIDSLSPFTEYSLVLQACTSVGCSSSVMVTGQTLPDQPMGLAAPNLTALSPSSIEAVWDFPQEPNGAIVRFELRQIFGPEQSQFTVVFDGLGLETTITGLTPNTLYTYQLVVFNAGGSGVSDTASVVTLEGVPDGVIPPTVMVVNSTTLNVTWSEPTIPNGVITEYILLQNGTTIFSGLTFYFVVSDLQPFSFYSFSIMACTIRNCSSSAPAVTMTPEALPTGYIPPTVVIITPTSISLIINPVISPNGIVTYILTINDTPDALYNSSIPSTTVAIDNLRPFTEYSLVLVVSNSAGSLIGPSFSLTTQPTVPEGLAPPTVTALNATTFRVDWTPPTSPNGLIQSYEIILTGDGTTEVYEQGLSVTSVLSRLRPFAVYYVIIRANNTVGSVISMATNFTTGETAPAGFDRIVPLEISSRYVLLSWDEPAAANGILVNYTVLLGGVVLTTAPPSVLVYNVTSLRPFTGYSFTVQACTSVGCVESPVLSLVTDQDIPEGLSELSITFVSGRVLITWTTPTTPNGIISEYRIERTTPSVANISLVGALTMEPFVIADINVRPFITYMYRLVVENGGGVAVGAFTSFTTPQAAPDGVLAPSLEAILSTAVTVTFAPPLTPNGIVTMYTITRLTPLTTFSFTPQSLPNDANQFTFNDSTLTPYTTYTYTLEVCTLGGCAVSDPSSVRTLEDTPAGVAMPTVVVVSSEELEVTWMDPNMPNGIIESYDLLRKFVGFEISPSPINCCEEYLSNRFNQSDKCDYVTSTDFNNTSFTDSELRPFTHYQYCIIVTNSAGSAFSEETTPTRTDPAPMPLGGPTLNATTINSTAIELRWSSVDTDILLGPLEGYTVFGGISGSPSLGAELFSGLELSFVATGLIASTEYVFVVSVSNGVGVAFSNNDTAVTEEGIPADLGAPLVTAVSDTSLSVTFSEPAEPNGVIILYTIYLDSMVVANATAPGTLLLTSLTPYTRYIVQVEACTQFGCTVSDLVSMRTLEGVPSGLASPFVTITGPTSANITWGAPNQPNGVITEYQVLLFTQGSTEATLLFSGLDFSASVTTLTPFTTYNLQVLAFNQAGNVSSLFTRRTTVEAPPAFVPPPTVSVQSSNEIVLTWSEPSELNGVLISYRIYRNNVALVSTSLLTTYSDNALEPATTYTFTLEACTNGGCTNSSQVSNTTFEALPEGVSDPILVNIGPRSVTIRWEAPTIPNGMITNYILTLLTNNTQLFNGLALSFELDNLTPYTNYSLLLETCNSIGCIPGARLDVQTLQDIPEGLNAPSLRDLTSTEVAIEWSAPTAPNGDIITYILRRGNESFPNDPAIIFQGLAFSFNDGGLLAATLYFYTIEVVNGAGSLTSSRSDFQTVPDLPGGISPPTVTVRGANEIFVSWSEPILPNGDISRYTLFINGNGIPLGISFEYTARELTPFTVYAFYFEVCNQAGCASSVSVTVVTEQALAEGVTPPTLTILGPTSIRVSWTPPISPNGVISRYEIRRRLFENIFTETIQHSGDSSDLSFTNIGLSPFTNYEYRWNVFNGAGNVLSEWISAMTDEDIPAGVSIPVIADEDIFARNVTASWLLPTALNGILLNYRLEYRSLIDPSTNLPGSIVVVDTYPTDVTMGTAVGLLPVTTYQFRVVAINGAGEGVSDFETITSGEDAPEQLQPIVVSARTGTSLSLSWNPPLTPNGQIRDYMLYLNEELVYDNSVAMTTIQNLQPFTNYSIQLVACTFVACGFGDVQSIATAPIAPADQPAPNVNALSARSVEVVWDATNRPNGIITLYEILRQNEGNPITVTTIASTSDVLNRRYIDTTVRPATSYEYAIRAINVIGNTVSGLRPIRTPEAAPEGVSAPSLSALSSTSILVTWTPPSLPNGVIQTYRVFRSGGGTFNMSVYDDLGTTFTDVLLSPFSEYSYFVQTCTLPGCTSGPPSSVTTDEDTPTNLRPPLLSAVSATSIAISWSPPNNPNGVIVSYTIVISPGNIQLTTTTDLSRVITNLLPFTLYAVNLEACNSVGCTQSNADARTQESIPQFLRSPTLSAINATAVQATWSEPSRPNGIIIRYILRRDGITIFDGNALMYMDAVLNPDTSYSYTLQAFTGAGSGEETNPTTIQTPTDTPEDIRPPLVMATSSSSIQVSWAPPGQPNGVIQRYVLLQDGTPVFNGLDFTYVANGLQPFTDYVFQLMVCTSTCGESTEVTERTLEAPPTGQAPPTLVRYRNTTVSITWSPPLSPNGVIISYLVERRLVPSGDFILISSQSVLSFLDQNDVLVPAMTYEYRITAINTAGQVASVPNSVTLFEAAPEGIPDILVTDVTAIAISVSITPPASPNGVLTNYTLYRNGQIENSIAANFPAIISFTSSNLDPFTTYTLYVEVCTNGGCGQSGVMNVRTLEAPPTGQAPPQATVLSATSVNLSWSPLGSPNGVIAGYTLWYRTACPAPPQPLLSLSPCIVGPRSLIVANFSSSELVFEFSGSGLAHPLPYTAYQFIVGAVNSVGSVESAHSISVTTQASAPVALPEGLVFMKDDESGVIFMDWSRAFQFNGQFQTSSVERNGILLVQRPITSLNLTNEPRGISLTYVVQVVTQDGQVSITSTTQLATIATPTTDPSTTTPPPVATETPFYQQAAFIIGMIVLGIVLLFLVIAVIVFLLVRPRGDSAYKVPPSKELRDVTSASQGYSKMEHSPSPKRLTPSPIPVTPSPNHTSGSWSPGDPYNGDIPDYASEDQGVVITPRRKKYTPRRMESASLIENEHLQLPDTIISSHVSPGQFVPASDDFGSFKAQQHTTFTDTKV